MTTKSLLPKKMTETQEVRVVSSMCFYRNHQNGSQNAFYNVATVPLYHITISIIYCFKKINTLQKSNELQLKLGSCL